MNIIIFLTTFLVSSIIPIFGRTSFYHVITTKNYYLEQSNINFARKDTFFVYITPSSKFKNSYEVGTLDPFAALFRNGIEIWNAGMMENLHHKYLEQFVQPFLVVYDDKHSFKYIKVRKDEFDAIKNVKLFLSTTVQVNNLKLHEGETSIPDHEITPIGKCNVHYKTKLLNKKNTLKTFLVSKNYDTKTCTTSDNNNRQIAEDRNYLKNICESEKKSHLHWIADSELIVSKEPTADRIIKNGTFSYVYEFNPLKNSGEKLLVDFRLMFKSISQFDLPNNLTIREYDDTNTVKMSQRIYQPINKSILTESDSEYPYLHKLYKSIVCAPHNLSAEFDNVLNVIMTHLRN